MIQLRLISIVCILGMLVNGCGVILPMTKNTSSLSKLKISMTTEEVSEAIGEPDEVRGSTGNNVVWQYDLYKTTDAFENLAFGIFMFTLTWWSGFNSGTPYWLYFRSNRLIQWGRAGDWEEAPYMIKKLSDGKE